jgi:cytochrome c551/c552
MHYFESIMSRKCCCMCHDMAHVRDHIDMEWKKCRDAYRPEARQMVMDLVHRHEHLKKLEQERGVGVHHGNGGMSKSR